jgi:hypothetical protein
MDNERRGFLKGLAGFFLAPFAAKAAGAGGGYARIRGASAARLTESTALSVGFTNQVVEEEVFTTLGPVMQRVVIPDQVVSLTALTEEGEAHEIPPDDVEIIPDHDDVLDHLGGEESPAPAPEEPREAAPADPGVCVYVDATGIWEGS